MEPRHRYLPIFSILFICSSTFVPWRTAMAELPAAQDGLRIGAASILPDDPATHFSRAVNFAPGDGETVSLNPPRFRWQYHPSVPGEGGDYRFRFQIARDPEFRDVVSDVDTPFNFYNTLAPLAGSARFYWRIGTFPGEGDKIEAWSAVRSFTVAPDAQVWDRSGLADPDFGARPHPRLIFTEETLPRLRYLVQSNPDSRVIFERMQEHADGALASPWWNHLPDSDEGPAQERYVRIAHDLALIAFVWRVTGDSRYADVIPNALKLARYPKGGLSSPEGAGGEKESNEDATQITEFLALLYDWLYPDLSLAERDDFVQSLDWRIEHFIFHFAWKYPDRVTGRPVVRGGSLATIGASHAFEGFFDTFPACLAAYEQSEAANVGFHLGVNYMAGVGSAHGFSEGWNEGPGYGNSKWAWQVNAASYLDSVFPDYNVGANPWLVRTGEFFRHQTPVGLEHAPWGHGSNRSSYYVNGHRRCYRKLGFLTGDGRFLADFLAWGGRLDRYMDRPWIECALPLWREQPEPTTEEDAIGFYPRSGWVMALSGPPSDPDTYNQGVGMVFCCRPRGGYSHSFCSDNSFHLFGYGQDLSHAAGTSEYEPHAYHSMSHNTILVDGLGQAQPRGPQKTPVFSRLIAFHRDSSLTYWCGDATLSYPRERFQPREWWGRLSELYEQRDLSHLRRANRHVVFMRNKYFVMLDDLEAAEPAKFTWLYHILPEGDLMLDADTGSFSYRVEDVRVEITHLLGAGQLDIQDMRGTQGFINPLTGEDYTEDRGRARGEREMIAEHNLYLTTRTPQARWRFLCVIIPIPPGQADTERKVERLDDLTVRVTAFGNTDVISFDPDTSHPATLRIDLPEIAKAGIHD